MFCKKGVFENFAKQKVFSCEFYEIFKNTFFHRAPPVAASEKLKVEAVGQTCSVKKVFLEMFKIHRKTPVPESLFYSFRPVTSLK